MRRPVFWIVLAIAAAVAIDLGVRYFPQAFSLVALDITMDRGRALDEARAIAARDGLGPAGFSQAASFGGDDEAQTFIELEGGGKELSVGAGASSGTASGAASGTSSSTSAANSNTGAVGAADDTTNAADDATSAADGTRDAASGTPNAAGGTSGHGARSRRDGDCAAASARGHGEAGGTGANDGGAATAIDADAHADTADDTNNDDRATAGPISDPAAAVGHHTQQRADSSVAKPELRQSVLHHARRDLRRPRTRRGATGVAGPR